MLPVQSLRMTVPDWSDKVGDPKAYLSTVDDEIAFAARERAFRGKWAFPAELARSARRNPTYAVDPYAIALEPLAAVERDPEKTHRRASRGAAAGVRRFVQRALRVHSGGIAACA